MKNNRQTKKLYTPPAISTVEIEPSSLMLAMSGQGTDTDGNHDFGGRGVNEHRGKWGNLWNE